MAAAASRRCWPEPKDRVEATQDGRSRLNNRSRVQVLPTHPVHNSPHHFVDEYIRDEQKFACSHRRV